MSEAPQDKRRIERDVDAGRIVVTADEAYLCAKLSLHPNDAGERFRSEEILAILAEMNVVRGINSDDIEWLIGKVAQTGEAAEDETIATGHESIPGADAYLEYPPVLNRVACETDPDDPQELSQSRILNVTADETVAIYHPLTDGVPGINLRGEYLPVEPGKDRTPRAGRNLRREGDRIIAEIDGRFLIQERSLLVDEDIRIEEDLTVLYGDIDFVGNIIVRGNVESGLHIHSHRDITVGGSIIGSTIFCEGNLKAQNGIVGSDDTHVEVKGDLEATFLENLDLRVWGNCRIKNSVVNSTVLCGQEFSMHGRGHVVSGQVHARDGITVNQVGIPVGTKVRLAAGADALAAQRIRELERDLEAIERRAERITEIDHEMGPMTRVYKSLTPQKRDEIEKLLEHLPNLQHQIEKLSRERNRLLKHLRKNFDAGITVQDMVCEDTVLEFPLGSMVVRPSVQKATFRFDTEQGEVIMTPRAA